MEKYIWHMGATIIISLLLTNITLKIVKNNNIWVDLLIYIAFAVLCTVVLMVFDRGFREFLKFW